MAERSHFMPRNNGKTKSFIVDARTIIHLGRDSIKNPTTALLELVKNSYDADAKIVEVEIKKDGIRIADNGVGMSETQLEENWLRIGFSEKRSQKVSKGSRRKTGEKGIGRLSTDRLGETLSLRTKARMTSPVELLVNWENFNVDGKSLSEVPITIAEVDDIKLPSPNEGTGTEITISNLRQSWLKTDIEQVYSELMALVSPFAGIKDFQIIFYNELLPELNGAVQSWYYDAAELSIQAKFDGRSQKIKYKITDKSGTKVNIAQDTVSWDKLSQRINNSGVGFNSQLTCGPVSIEILFFPRTGSNPLLKNQGFSFSNMRQFLDKNLGIKIYRDNISVKPYGYNNEPSGGDWLGLAQRKERDPAGLLRPTYKMSSHQLVGAVSIGRDSNSQLTDGASREGFVENDSFYDLRALTLSCVTLLESYRHEKALKEKKKKDKDNKPLIEEVETYKHDLESLQKNLETLKGSLEGNTGAESLKSLENIEVVIQQTAESKRRIEELLDNNRVLSGLATVGIAAAVFGHETQTAVSLFRSGVSAAQSALSLKSGPDVKRALGHLSTSLQYAKQVSSWGAFAMARVRRDKRTRQKVSVKSTVEGVLSEVEEAFKAIRIKLVKDVKEVDAKVFVMDIESIVLNLMTNAYTACSTSKKREIRVELHGKKKGGVNGFEIVVADSGPGIDKSIENAIWEPLFTTKKDKSGREDGTGLGLSIVKSTVEELGGTHEVLKDSKLKGAQFRVWLPAHS